MNFEKPGQGHIFKKQLKLKVVDNFIGDPFLVL